MINDEMSLLYSSDVGPKPSAQRGGIRKWCTAGTSSYNNSLAVKFYRVKAMKGLYYGPYFNNISSRSEEHKPNPFLLTSCWAGYMTCSAKVFQLIERSIRLLSVICIHTSMSEICSKISDFVPGGAIELLVQAPVAS